MTDTLIVSAGEPAGIAPEIIAASWQHYRPKDIHFAVLGDSTLLARRGGIPVEEITALEQARQIFPTALPVLPCRLVEDVTPGQPRPANGKSVIEAIRHAAAFCLQQQAAAMVTAPIDKAILQQSGFDHRGHTDYLATLAGVDHSVMMLRAPQNLRCVPLTVHIALREAIALIDEPLLERTLTTIAEFLLSEIHDRKPRIAVGGLNPHAGEGGLMGDEEQTILIPALERLRPRLAGLTIDGPFPTDSMFTPTMRARYDCFVAMTHDQALIPIKTLAFDQAVNVTLGLGFPRTSPDHGTAYDLAGTDRASPHSMIAAIAEAAHMTTKV